ncbi:uncharacterized protein AB9W97_003723 [Spinachia spinachia]
MSGLLREIEHIDKPAADQLKDAGLQSDSDIQALTECDLRDLLPGSVNIKRRRAISNMIQPPIERILQELKGFIPEESLRAPLTKSGVSVDYLRLLMDMKSQMNKVLTVIEAQIICLNEYKANPWDQESASSQEDKMDTSSGETDGHTTAPRRSPEEPKTQSQPSPQAAAATPYRMVVGGQTFATHLKLMEQIKKQTKNQLYEDEADNHSVTFVFCPISSRVASDVEAAMSPVTDDKPVILVLMHHKPKVISTTTMTTWNVDAKVVLHVNVFYHETCGLLQCVENKAAVTEIGNKLSKLVPERSHTSGSSQS